MKRKESAFESAAERLPEYGQQKLPLCADSYRNIARVIMNFPPQTDNRAVENRADALYHRRLRENQNFMARQFLSLADQISRLADESYSYIYSGDTKYKEIARLLRAEDILVRHIYFMEDENKDGVVEVTMCSRQGRVPARDVAAMLGTFYDMRLIPSAKSPYFIEEEYHSFTFVQEPAYNIIVGQAAAAQDGEDVSGDDVLVMEGIDGHEILLLADGVGSGAQALGCSEKILEFMEKFLLAGYSKEEVIQLLNDLLMQEGQETWMSTLDVCDINLYRGFCECYKIGAPAGYHKRQDMVERIQVANLPLGAFETLNLDSVRIRLEDGDYMILLSDGVVEGLQEEEKLARLEEYISRLDLMNPREMSKAILDYSIQLHRGKAADDMTVVAAGIWRN
ncbi:MAG: serine/threonine-protein phosphatase [Lachnospiraceae bacterium]|nr:serine/threonine-protein phosphatase [Lachnospiraceae bacterium]